MDITRTGAAVASWSPETDSLRSVANGLRVLLRSMNQGDFVPPDEDWFDAVVKHETLRLGVCGVVDECMKQDSAVPTNLRKQLLANFLYRGVHYLQAAFELAQLNGEILWNVIGD